MNRGAVVCFLLLAALVGMSAAFDERTLVAFGERLLAIQSDINANSTYHPLPRLQTAAVGGRLAFLELGDSGGWDVPVYFDGGYGSGYDYNYQQPSYSDQQTSWNFDTPTDFNYYNYSQPTIEPQTSWDSDVSAPFDYSAYPYESQTTWDSDVSAPFDYSSYPVEYTWDSDVSAPFDYAAWASPTYTPNTDDPNGYGALYTPNGQPYPTVDLSRGGGTQTTGGGPSGRTGAGDNSVIGQGPEPRNLGGNQGTLQQQLIYNNSLTIAETQNYMLGVGGGTSYTPAWYERAFPGWGTAVIPLLPSQYQPYGYGYNNNCYGGNGLTGALALDSNGNFGVALGVGQQNYPCYPNYSSYVYGSGYYGSQIQPTCSITLADATIAYGAAAQLQWNSYDATSASLNGFGSVPLSGTRTFNNQTVSRTYGLTVSGPGGTGACYVTLSVAPQPPQPTCQIKAEPTSVAKGSRTKLTWITQNATNAALSGFGEVELQGSKDAFPTKDTTFTLAVKGAGNREGSCTTQVFVR